MLRIVDAMSKRADLTHHLDLSPALVALFAEHPVWFSLPDNQLSMRSLYMLSQYAYIVRVSEYDEAQVLDYLWLINTAWPSPDLLPDQQGYQEQNGQRQIIRNSAAYKLAVILRWSVREVLKASAHANPEYGVVFDVKELALLMRMRLFGQSVGLDAQALLALGGLTPTSRLNAYRHAAELALTSINETVLGKLSEEVGKPHTSTIIATRDYLVANNPNDPGTTLTLTLHDLTGEPLAHVLVTWTTTMGSLRVIQNTTDEQGRATNTLMSGTLVGVARVVAEYGLRESIVAPAITIDCDEASLHLIESTFSSPMARADNQDTINFGITLIDEYGNKGVGRYVEWGVTDVGEFLSSRTLTDEQGIARASLRSSVAGPTKVIVQYKNGSSQTFEYISFNGKPYIEYVRFSHALVAGENVALECRLTYVGGSPLVGRVVSWKTNHPGLIKNSGVTDSNGVCRVEYIAPKSGITVQVLVEVIEEGERIIEAVSEVALQRSMQDPEKTTISTREYVLGDPRPVVATLKLLSQPGSGFSNAEVIWLDGHGVKYTTATDIHGVTSFSTKSFKLGRNTIAALSPRGLPYVGFSVEGIAEFSFQTVLMSPDRLHEHPNFISGDHTYTLNVKTLNDEGEPVAGRIYSLKNMGDDLALLGVTVSDIDIDIVSTVEGHDFSIRGTVNRHGSLLLRLISESTVAQLDLNYTLGTAYYAERSWYEKSRHSHAVQYKAYTSDPSKASAVGGLPYLMAQRAVDGVMDPYRFGINITYETLSTASPRLACRAFIHRRGEEDGLKYDYHLPEGTYSNNIFEPAVLKDGVLELSNDESSK